MWDVFPLFMQVIYVAASVPAFARLVRQKRSDQRALADHWVTLTAHGGMLAWALVYAQQPGMAASIAIGIVTTITSATLIARYRLYPGGKPGDVARAPSRLHPARADAMPRLPF